ncbi:TetR/AcrR family transcriptional regulator C-terminal domain-containing protein [Cloacibacillus sp.]
MPKTEITKAALGSCLRELMVQKRLSQITIKDITTKCGVSRNAFYYHFRDKYDLIHWIFYSETLPVINTFSDPDRYLDGFVCLCKYMLENREFYMEVFHYVGQNSLSESLVESYFELMKIHILTVYAQIGYRLGEDELYILARLEAYAYVGIIMEWVKGGMHENYMIYFEKLKKVKTGLTFPLEPTEMTEYTVAKREFDLRRKTI